MTIQDLHTPIDLDGLTRGLAQTFAGQQLAGSVVGRTIIRDAVARRLGCSQLEAEQVVDTLILRGKLVLVRDPEDPPMWTFRDT